MNEKIVKMENRAERQKVQAPSSSSHDECHAFEGKGDYKGYRLLALNRGGGAWKQESSKYVSKSYSPDSKVSCVNPNFLNYVDLKNAEIIEEYKLPNEAHPRRETYKWDDDTLSLKSQSHLPAARCLSMTLNETIFKQRKGSWFFARS